MMVADCPPRELRGFGWLTLDSGALKRGRPGTLRQVARVPERLPPGVTGCPPPANRAPDKFR